MTESAPAAMALVMSPEYLMPPSAMSGMPFVPRHLGDVGDGRDLGDAGAGDDPGRADRPRADPDLDRVDAEVDELLGRPGRADVAGDELLAGELLLAGA